MVLESLGLDKLKGKKVKLDEVHSRSYEHRISEETKLKLKSFYEPYNNKLFQLINKKYNW